MLRSGQKLLEVCVSEAASHQSTAPVECPQCEQACRPIQKCGVNITTLCGKIRVQRWVYKCVSGHYHRPWDMCQKLKGKWTRRVVERMCYMAVHFDYRAAAKELSFQGIKVSHTTLHKKVREWTEALSATQQVAPQKLEENQRWSVSCDGCYTNSPDGWKEVKVGCMDRDYPQYGVDVAPSARTSSIRYVAPRKDAAHFGKELFSLATNSGIYQEAIGTQEIVFIGDGASWIWNLAAEYFPNAVEIVDYMHAKSYLYEVAKQAFGEHQTTPIEKWVEATDLFLDEGDTAEVVSCIRSLGMQNPDVVDILDKEARYFEKHSERMRYKMFGKKGSRSVVV